MHCLIIIIKEKKKKNSQGKPAGNRIFSCEYSCFLTVIGQLLPQPITSVSPRLIKPLTPKATISLDQNLYLETSNRYSNYSWASMSRQRGRHYEI